MKKRFINLLGFCAIVAGSAAPLFTTSCGKTVVKPQEIIASWEGLQTGTAFQAVGGYPGDSPGDARLSALVHPDSADQEVIWKNDCSDPDLITVTDEGKIHWSAVKNGQSSFNFNIWAVSKKFPKIESNKINFNLNVGATPPTSIDLEWDTTGVHQISGYIHQAGEYKDKELKVNIQPVDADQNCSLSVSCPTDPGLIYIKTEEDKKYIAWNAANVDDKKVVDFSITATPNAANNLHDTESFQLTLNKPDPTELQMNYTGASTNLTGYINHSGEDTNTITTTALPTYAVQPASYLYSIKPVDTNDDVSFIHFKSSNSHIYWDSCATQGQHRFKVVAACNNITVPVQVEKEFTLTLNYATPSGINLQWDGEKKLTKSVNEAGTTEQAFTATITNQQDCQSGLHVDLSISSTVTNIENYVCITSDNKIQWKAQTTEVTIPFSVVAKVREYPEVTTSITGFVFTTKYSAPTSITLNWSGGEESINGNIYKAGVSDGQFTAAINGTNINPNLSIDWSIQSEFSTVYLTEDHKIGWGNETQTGTKAVTVTVTVHGATSITNTKTVNLCLTKQNPTTFSIVYTGANPYDIGSTYDPGCTTQTLNYSYDSSACNDPNVQFSIKKETVQPQSVKEYLSINKSKQIAWTGDVCTCHSDQVTFDIDACSTIYPEIPHQTLHFTLITSKTNPTSITLNFSGSTTQTVTLGTQGNLNGNLSATFSPEQSGGTVRYEILNESNTNVVSITGTNIRYDVSDKTDPETITFSVKAICNEHPTHITDTKSFTLNVVRPAPASIKWNTCSIPSIINGYIHQAGQSSGILIASVDPELAEQNITYSISWNGSAPTNVTVTFNQQQHNVEWTASTGSETIDASFYITATCTVDNTTISSNYATLFRLSLAKPNPTSMTINWNGTTALTGTVGTAGSAIGDDSHGLTCSGSPDYALPITSVTYEVINEKINGSNSSSNLVSVAQEGGIYKIKWNAYTESNDTTNVTFTIKATCTQYNLTATKDFTLTLDYKHASNMSINWSGENDVITHAANREYTSEETLSVAYNPTDIPVEDNDITWSVQSKPDWAPISIENKHIHWTSFTCSQNTCTITVKAYSTKHNLDATKQFTINFSMLPTGITLNYLGESTTLLGACKHSGTVSNLFNVSCTGGTSSDFRYELVDCDCSYVSIDNSSGKISWTNQFTAEQDITFSVKVYLRDDANVSSTVSGLTLKILPSQVYEPVDIQSSSVTSNNIEWGSTGHHYGNYTVNVTTTSSQDFFSSSSQYTIIPKLTVTVPIENDKQGKWQNLTTIYCDDTHYPISTVSSIFSFSPTIISVSGYMTFTYSFSIIGDATDYSSVIPNYPTTTGSAWHIYPWWNTVSLQQGMELSFKLSLIIKHNISGGLYLPVCDKHCLHCFNVNCTLWC